MSAIMEDLRNMSRGLAVALLILSGCAIRSPDAPQMGNDIPAATVAPPSGTPSLHYAAASGNLVRLKALVSAGADVNTREEWTGKTALHLAAGAGEVDAVITLVEMGAEVDARTEGGTLPSLERTPLHLAAAATMNNPTDALSALIAFGADVNAVDVMGNTPLHFALKNVLLGNVPSLVEALLDAGANPMVRNNKGLTPLDSRMLPVLFEYNKSIYRRLVQAASQ